MVDAVEDAKKDVVDMGHAAGAFDAVMGGFERARFGGSFD